MKKLLWFAYAAWYVAYFFFEKPSRSLGFSIMAKNDKKKIKKDLQIKKEDVIVREHEASLAGSFS